MSQKVVREGRIVIWEGGSLWAFDVRSDANLRPNNMHEHHAFQLTFGAGGYANIRTPSGLLHGPVILIAPDAPPLIEPAGRMVLVFGEP